MRVALASAAAFCAWCMLTSDALAGVPPTRKCQSVTIHATVKVDRTTYVLTGAVLCPGRTIVMVGRQQGR